MKTFILLTLACIGSITGDFYCKDHSILAIASYWSATVIFVLLIQHSGLIYSTFMWGIITTVACLLIGFYKYHETFNAVQAVGCGFAFVAVILLQWET